MADRMNDPRTNPESFSFSPRNRDEGRSIGEEVAWRFPALNPSKPSGTNEEGWAGFQEGRGG